MAVTRHTYSALRMREGRRLPGLVTLDATEAALGPRCPAAMKPKR